ncbi:MAG TPA: hypothetical protein VNN07_11990 [Candidatus Tectomicrobia bacterium]|nr:hypothetical protein [Candidatus Tectomicrobia bacterium]
MIDVIAAIALTGLAVVNPGALILASPLGAVAARRIAVGAAVWLIGIAGLAAAGLFAASSPIGTQAIGTAVLLPVVALVLGASRASAIRRLALGTPIAVLVALHVGRLLGAFFLWLHAEGRLPWTFATYAGWGDIAVAAAAVPVAWAAHRRVPGWRPLVLAWNAVGLADLLTAVGLGLLSGATSPLRLIHESPDTAAMGTLPWLLVPGFLVPIYIAAHLAVFAQLRARA